MKEKIKLTAAILLLLILIPYMITLFFNGASIHLFQDKDDISVREEQVLYLLSEEISGQSQLEALKAQAVIARTQLYLDPDMEITGNETNLLENMDHLTFAVEDTQGEIVTYEDQPIDPAYHAVSGKMTRNSSEVAGQEDKLYLQSVESLYDISSDEYLVIVYMEKSELAEKIQELIQQTPSAEMSDASEETTPDITVVPETILTDLVIEQRDSAEYVTKVRYQEVILNGEALADALELPSSLFYLTELEGKVRVMTKGLGHGLGLSQYGANAMAAEGKNYQEILKYYYQGVEIQSSNR